MDKKWLIFGGLSIAGILIFVVTQGSGGSTPAATGQQNIGPAVTSNTGTPATNNSLLGFIDPATGVQWVLDSADQWVAALPQGALPPNYTPGAALVLGSPVATSTSN